MTIPRRAPPLLSPDGLSMPAGPGLPQLVGDIQSDIVVTRTMLLEQGAQAGPFASAAGARWHDPPVIAGTIAFSGI